MIQFTCQCGRQLQAGEEHVGKQVRCPSCGGVSVVPAAQAFAPVEEVPLRPQRPRPEAVRSERQDDDRERDRGRDRRRGREDDEDDRPRRRRQEEPSGSSGKATVSLILGLLSFPCVCNLFTGLPAILFAALALLDISKSGGRLGGKFLAWAGLITGCIGTLCVTPTASWWYWWKLPEMKSNMVEHNNLKQMTLAMHNFASTYNGKFPQAAAYRSPEGKPLLSWRVAILPYIEQDGLYSQFHLDEPWDSPHNKKLLARMPNTYLQPGEKPGESGLTRYQVFVGVGAPFQDVRLPPERPGLQFGPTMATFQDGTSNTILIAVAEQGVPWTKPDDLAYDPKGPLPGLNKRFSGYNVGLADGSVRVLSFSITEQTLRNAINPNDGNPLGPDW